MAVVRKICFFVWIAYALFSCKHDPIEPPKQVVIPPDTNDTITVDTNWRTTPSNICDADSVYFENQIHKLIVTRCTPENFDEGVCHGGSFARSKNVDLRTYEGILEEIDTDRLDEPLRSDLYEVISENTMPRVLSSFTESEKMLVEKWIRQGAKNNRCNDCATTSDPDFNMDIAPLMLDNCGGCHNNAANGRLAFFNFPPTASNAIQKNIDDNIAFILGRITPTENNSNMMPKHLQTLYECEVQLIQDYAASL